jgi:hypothetical protein
MPLPAVGIHQSSPFPVWHGVHINKIGYSDNQKLLNIGE